MKRSNLVSMAAVLVAAWAQPSFAQEVTAASAPACSVAGPGFSCVMTGLDNPRGLAFGLDGALFVAEAGRGGAPCGAVQFNCYGHTGAVSRYWNGRQDRVATGLPSLSFPLGASSRGPHDIVTRAPGRTRGSALGTRGAMITVGREKDPAVRSAPGRADFAKLIHLPDSTLYADSAALCTHACWTPVVDLGGYVAPDGMYTNPETDPYGMIAEKDGVVLTDASRNWLMKVTDDGDISVIAALPSRKPDGRITDSVPTVVAKGPDGAYYVGELVGIPFAGPTRPPSNIYRVDPDNPDDVTVFLTGFNAIIDMAFHGNTIYVLQHWTTQATGADGRLLKGKCGGRPLACEMDAEPMLANLDRATAILVEQGAIYMSLHGANAAFPSQTGAYNPVGEVIRIEIPDDED